MSDCYYVEKKKSNGVAIAAMVCAIVAIFINPMYLVSLAAIILGIVGLAQRGCSKGMSLFGLLGGITSFIIQFVVDLLITICTLGFGFFAFFI